MKLHVMSDLHLEMRSWKQFVQQMLPGGDILVLAGDISYLRWIDQALPVFEAICARYDWVYYVLGNHEYYKSSVNSAHAVLDVVASKIPNLVVLKPGVISNLEIGPEKKRILGGTMWFRDDPMNIMYEDQLNDFYQIEGFKPWVYEENKRTLDFLQKEVKEGDIVVTHHMPTPQSVPTRFRGGTLDRFFLCDVSDIIGEKQPALWVHGHSHDACDYMAGKTRVYANPLGYPSEKANPNWKQLIEIHV